MRYIRYQWSIQARVSQTHELCALGVDNRRIYRPLGIRISPKLMRPNLNKKTKLDFYPFRLKIYKGLSLGNRRK